VLQLKIVLQDEIGVIFSAFEATTTFSMKPKTAITSQSLQQKPKKQDMEKVRVRLKSKNG
jgi:hypothetical protein